MSAADDDPFDGLYTFTIDDLKPLSDWLMHQSLPYDDAPLRDVVNRIVGIVEAHELANGPSSPTQGS